LDYHSIHVSGFLHAPAGAGCHKDGAAGADAFVAPVEVQLWGFVGKTTLAMEAYEIGIFDGNSSGN
jgi:hypothetical protein